MAASSERTYSCFATRGSEGFQLNAFRPDLKNVISEKEGFPSVTKCSALAFSNNGEKCAFTDGQGVSVMRVHDSTLLRIIPRPRTTKIKFSPKGTVLVLYQPYMILQNETKGAPNLTIWDSEPKDASDDSPLRELIQKKHTTWALQFTEDEALSARIMNNEVHLFEANKYGEAAHKLHVVKIAEFSLAPQRAPPYHISAYVPGSKGQPSFVRIWKYPDFRGPNCSLGNKSFYKADRVDMIWNRKGTALLILTASDTSAESYYGEQGLHYLDTKGNSCMVSRGKNGPVYSVEWNPDSETFCVVYGFMPAKATLYNLKADPIFEFGTGPRNLAFYNPHGSILCLAGFGNLRGNIEFFDLDTKTMISSCKAPDTTYFEWCPDGEHFITATTSPRLRVGNGFKLWHLMGEQVFSWSAPGTTELFEAMWQPADQDVFPDPKHILSRIARQTGPQAAQRKAAEPKAYVAPHLRGNPQAQAALKSSFKEEYEGPSEVRKTSRTIPGLPVGAAAQEPAGAKSKSRNRRKKKGKKDLDGTETGANEGVGAEAEEEEFSLGGAAPAAAAAPEAAAPEAAANVSSATVFKPTIGSAQYTGDPEKDKQIKKIHKKLQDIDVLKQKFAAGLKLQDSQITKMKTEMSLQAEISRLHV